MSSRTTRTAAFRRSLGPLVLAVACGPESNPVYPPEPAPAILVLAESSVSFSVAEGAAAPQAVEIDVANGGERVFAGLSAAVEYGVGHSDGWLTASLEGTDAPTRLRIAAETSSLAPGAYEATVHVRAGGAQNSPDSVTVSLTVEPGPEAPRFESSASRVTFEVAEGDPDPPPAVVEITNVGDLPLDEMTLEVVYLPGSASGWLSASLDGTSAPTLLHVSVAANGLGSGSYHGRVRIEADSASNSLLLPVDLVVRAPEPSIALAWERREFHGYEGRDFVEPYGLTVTNGGQGTLGEISFGVEYAAGQPTGWLTATANGTEAPMNIALEPSAVSLPAGSYEALLIVSSPRAAIGSDTATVVLQVAPPGPVIGLARTDLVFNAEQHGPPPQPQTVEITNVGEGTLSGLSIATAAGWLSASLDRTTAPATLTVTVSTAGLVVDRHTAMLQISSPVAQNPYGQETLTVAFEVQVGSPDLLVEGDLVSPAVVAAGDPLTLSAVVERNGGTGFAGSHRAGIYISSDSALTRADILVESQSIQGSQPGETRPLPTQVSIPSSTPPGDYFIGVLLDADDVVFESNETNNFVSTPIRVTPPITRYALDVVGTGDAGWVDVEPSGSVFDEGTVVTLTAYPSPAHDFQGWGGDASGIDNPLQIVMDGDKTVSAAFTLAPPMLFGGGGAGLASLNWSYQWPCRPDSTGRCTASPSDRFVLEESTTGDPGDFQVVHTVASNRDSDGFVTLQRLGGVWYYRLRAEGDGFVTPYSEVLSVTVFDPEE